MIWAMAVLLAALTFAAIVWLMKAPRAGWEMIGAALLLGIAGYALQASPGLPGAPKASPAETAADTAEVVEARRALAGNETLSGDKWMMIGDALARNGHFSDAAAVLLGAVEKDPKPIRRTRGRRFSWASPWRAAASWQKAARCGPISLRKRLPTRLTVRISRNV